MASRKFRFVSPGVFLKEIDNSQIPGIPEGVGPVIIGRTRTGPSMRPYKIRSLEELERVFGKPMPGNQGDDPWRDGTDLLAESYAPYAARAYLRASDGSGAPVTMVRLAGVAGEDAAANGDGEPGWKTDFAYGIFAMPSGSGGWEGTGSAYQSADLVSVLYAPTEAFTASLRGSRLDEGLNSDVGLVHRAAQTVGAGVVVRVKDNNKISLVLADGPASIDRTVKFTFDEMRSVLNTNPASTNSQISQVLTSSLSSLYWLGESFQETYKKVSSTKMANRGSGAQGTALVLLKLDPLISDSQSANHGARAATTGWVFGQDTTSPVGSYDPSAQERLFRIVSLHEGFQASKDIIISIEDISIPRDNSLEKYGTFSVVVSRIFPSDLVEIERFDNCNLDPTSQDFVAKKIGDQYREWSPSEKRNRTYGSNPNVSDFIRVEMDDNVGQYGPSVTNQVPFGFYGPVVPRDIIVPVANGGTGTIPSNQWVDDADKILCEQIFSVGSSPGANATGSIRLRWPRIPLVNTASSGDGFMMGVTPYKQTYTGYVSGVSGLDNIYNSTVSDARNPSYVDHLRRMPSFGSLAGDQDTGLASAASQYSFRFSLDEVVVKPAPGKALSAVVTTADVAGVWYQSGSRNAALEDVDFSLPRSATASAGTPGSFSQHVAYGTGSIRTLLNLVQGFRMPLVGGSEGTNILEPDPFNARVLGSSATTANSYAYASVDRAVELVKDPEVVEHNLAVMPGITNESLTTKLVRACETRGDSLAIIDLPDIYVPPSQKICKNFKDRVDDTTPEKSAQALVNRQLNSSYGCTYYPWVKIRDEEFTRDVWVPPSVVALGIMAHTEKRDEVWFAPAGFNRGGLNQGNSGLPVLQVSEQLLSKDRDTLYQANINPIASFVSEGIVVFGQKTLQSSQSALDRINVRRLLIFVKKEVSRISNNLLFEQNVQATWKRFLNKVVPMLEKVKIRFGLTDFKVVLDGTTTTPDLVDRNIMYAKIFLKPARAIEFIAVDFVITNTGAGFND